MSLLYRKFQNKNKKSTTYNQWYGQAMVINHVSTKDLAREIASATTVTCTDVIAVLSGLTEAMGRHLCNSDSVTLDGIGTFKVGMQTKPAKAARSFTAKNIHSYHINYRPVRHFVANGQVTQKGFPRGMYAKDLLDGITAKEAPKNLYGKRKKRDNK